MSHAQQHIHSGKGFMSRAILTIAAATLLSGAMTGAAYAEEPSTRLISCGSQSCLLVSGHRAKAGSPVMINGHAVDVEGRRNWRVSLPIATVRDWSAPFARRITVSSQDDPAGEQTIQHAELPIGLLGHVPDLASLVITVH